MDFKRYIKKDGKITEVNEAEFKMTKGEFNKMKKRYDLVVDAILTLKAVSLSKTKNSKKDMMMAIENNDTAKAVTLFKNHKKMLTDIVRTM